MFVIMDRIINAPYGCESTDYAPKYGHGDTVPIDQQPACGFNIDPATGRPMSDLTALTRAKSLDQERILANFRQFEEEYLSKDISDTDALKYACPRLAQLPSEIAEHQEFVAQKLLEEEKVKKEAAELEAFRKAMSEKKDEEVETKS